MAAMTHPSLQIPSANDSYQHIFWRAQRWSWLAMALLLVIAALGLLGGFGPLNTSSYQGGNFAMHYPRVARRDDAEQFTFKLGTIQNGQAQLVLEHDFLSKFDVKQIVPQPQSVEAQGDYYIYTFSASGSQTATVSFSVWPGNTTLGIIHGKAGTSFQDLHAITQVELP